MDLWIRSQDRTKLIKSEGVFLFIDGEYHICSGIDGSIAKYKTKERALEIIDEIQKLLKPQLYLKQWESVVKQEVDELVHIVNPTYEEVKELSTYVYQMPEE